MRFLAFMVLGLGLVLFVEGTIYAAFPGGVRRMLLQLQEMRPGTLRALGLGAMAAGLALIYLFTRLSG